MEKPESLPAYPPAPSGKRWQYQGMGWVSENPTIYIICQLDDEEWLGEDYAPESAGGNIHTHYAELVNNPKGQEEDDMKAFYEFLKTKETPFSYFDVWVAAVKYARK